MPLDASPSSIAFPVKPATKPSASDSISSSFRTTETFIPFPPKKIFSLSAVSTGRFSPATY